MRYAITCCLLLVTTMAHATNTRKIIIDPSADSERAFDLTKTTKFTATLQDSSGNVIKEQIQISYKNKQGKVIKTNTDPNGTVSIDVPKSEIKTFLIQASAGTSTAGPVKMVVVNVALKEDSAHFPTKRKVKGNLYATGSHLVGADKLKPLAENDPQGVFNWSHPRADSFNPLDGQETTLKTKAEATVAKDQDLLTVKFVLSSSSETCTASKPLNITTPTKFSSPQEGVFHDVTLGDFRSDNKPVIPMIDPIKEVFYYLSDQFGVEMKYSNEGGKALMDKENLPDGWGGFPASVAWAKVNINPGKPQGLWTKITSEPESYFKDRIGIANFPERELLVQVPNDPAKPNGGKHWRLHPDLRQEGAVILSLAPHNWKISISENMVKDVSINDMQVTVTDWRLAPANNRIDLFKVKVVYKVILK